MRREHSLSIMFIDFRGGKAFWVFCQASLQDGSRCSKFTRKLTVSRLWGIHGAKLTERAQTKCFTNLIEQHPIFWHHSLKTYMKRLEKGFLTRNKKVKMNRLNECASLWMRGLYSHSGRIHWKQLGENWWVYLPETRRTYGKQKWSPPSMHLMAWDLMLLLREIYFRWLSSRKVTLKSKMKLASCLLWG